MKTKIIKITRTLVLKDTTTMEVPIDTNLEELGYALDDECELFDLVENKGNLGEFDLKQDSNEFEIELVTEPCQPAISFEDAKAALESDELLPTE